MVILDATRRIVEERRQHAGIELLFTPQEEVSLRGADAFDHTRLQATTGFVYDQGAPIGEIVLGSPHGRLLDFRFHGRAAHAGMTPEDGRSAIAAASRAIADFRLGRVDEETSANVGVISGGTARNVVPEWCSFTAEVRSHDEAKAVALAREMLESRRVRRQPRRLRGGERGSSELPRATASGRAIRRSCSLRLRCVPPGMRRATR